jgi:indolepyruvate ferredoxin oxidoreductase
VSATIIEYELTDRYERTDGRVLLTGIQALARIPIEQLRRDQKAGLRTAAFLSGYPGSPLGGLDQELARAARLYPQLPIVHRPAVNEELAATAVMGSQLAPGRPDATHEGVVGIWYGKAPGLDRAGDALRHGVFAGSSPKGGAVVLVGDDPDCKSSTMPSSSDASLVDLHMAILYPGTTAECLELGLHAVAMSRASGLWSSMKIVTPVADGSGTVTLPILDADPVMPTLDIDGTRWENHPSAHFLGPRMLDVEREFREIRLPLAQRYGVENGLNRVTVDPSDAWIGLVATGFTYVEMVDALRRLGFADERALAEAGVRLLQLRMPVPFHADIVRSFARGLDEIVVVEEKNPTLEWLVKDALYGGANQPKVLGKHHEDGRPLMRSWGRLDADAMLAGLRERLSARLASRLAPEPPPARTKPLIPLSIARTPFFCSGCPHNWGTKVPDGALVGAGTGCHGMTLLMDPERVGESVGITAMGNEGAQWIGMEPFVEADHLFQNYGDGTFFHSAQLAIQYCVAAGVHVTFKILYNGTVAMTGGQDATNQVGVPELARILQAYGVSKVAITTEDPRRYADADLPRGVEVRDRTDIVAVQEALRATPGVTVLIHDQACAAELRRARKRGKLEMPTRRVVINHRVCEGCGDCGDVSNCLSVQPIDTPLGRKTTIDQASCNFDYSCIKGDCPAFMTVELTSAEGNGGGASRQGDLVPDPQPTADRDVVRIRTAGIGGTGVVTVAQILSTAAMLDGWEVRGLDQTGLSQKAGPVISDIVLARPGTRTSNLVGQGQADLLLGFDALVAASDGVITATNPATVLIASTHRTPPGRMIARPDIAYPDRAVMERLDDVGPAGGNRYVDATDMVTRLVGTATPANTFLLGVAVQDGHIPVAVDALERAITLNGVAVDTNLAAFDWGRRWAHDPAAVEALASASAAGPADVAATVTVPELANGLAARARALATTDELADTVCLLAADLVGFQDERYAGKFLDGVARAAEHERRVADSTELTEAVARSLHKLMAYKDEYEVARLLLLPEGQLAADAVAGSAAATTTWHLHPPMLRALGMDRKIELGQWARPALRALRASKRLRGTRLDPFGRTEMRRTERALVGEFLVAMDEVYAHLGPENLADAVAIAKLPDVVRGYEDLKLRRVRDYSRELADRLRRFTSVPTIR